jgi:hypothetical protein
MHFSRFSTFSGEDFACEKHEFVFASLKEYVNCTDQSSTCIPCKTALKRFVGYLGHTSLIAVNKLNENVCY